MFSSCLSLSTYYRVLQTENVYKMLLSTQSTLQVMAIADVDKLKQKLLMNSDVIQLLIPSIYSKTHCFITDQKKR